MADVSTTTSNLSATIMTYYEKRTLERLVPKLVFYEDAQKKPLPSGSGKTVTFVRFKNLPKGGLLTEGSSPNGTALSAENVSCSISQLGAYVNTTDMIEATSISDVVKEATDIIGDAAALTVDQFIGRMLLWRRASISATLNKELSTIGKLSASQMACNILRNGTGNMALLALSGLDASSTLSIKLCRLAKKYLEGLDAPKFPDGTYHAVAHPDALSELGATSAWSDWHKYTTLQAMLTGEVGKCQGIRFKASTNAPKATKAGAATSAYGGGVVHMTYVYSPISYGVTHISNMKGKQKGAEIIIKRVGEQSMDDPLNQRPTKIGYKITMAAKVLNVSTCLWIFSAQGADTVTI